MKSTNDKILLDKRAGVGWLIINNPERRNAISLEMWEAVPRILDDFEADPAVRVIVVKGAGDKAFISGADISQFEQIRSSPEQVERYEDVADEAGRRFDFHALRVQCATELERGKAGMKVRQERLRHATIGLTMNTYTLIGSTEAQTAALEALPG